MRKSINKTTVIIVLAVFLTLSIGYALFSDTITIEGTATAQGTFDIKAECMTTVPDDIQTIIGSQYINYPDDGYNNEVCTVNDDTITYSVGLKYPGAGRYFTVKLTNVGTISAKLNTEYLVNPSSNVTCVDGRDGESNDNIENNECTNEDLGIFKNGFSEVAAVEKNNTIIYPSDDEWSSVGTDFSLVENNIGYYILKPGNSIYVVYETYLNDDADKILGNKFLAKNTVTYDMNFEQYNQ